MGLEETVNEDFNGEIKLDVRDSTPDWAPYALKTAPEGAPNVLVVLYDDTPARTSARAWFMAGFYGAQAAILDGGLGKWRAEGRPLESGNRT